MWQGLNHLQQLSKMDARNTDFLIRKVGFLNVDHGQEVEFLSVRIHGRVHHDPGDPGLQFGLFAEILDPLENLDKSLLKNVLRFGGGLGVS